MNPPYLILNPAKQQSIRLKFAFWKDRQAQKRAIDEFTEAVRKMTPAIEEATRRMQQAMKQISISHERR